MYQTRILVVDDDPGIRRLIKTSLESSIYKSSMASDGEEAMCLLEVELPDLMIVSISLRGISGLEVCRRVRESSDIPVLMLGSRDQARYETECLNAGADDYLKVPFDVEELVAHIKALLRRSSKYDYRNLPQSFVLGNLEIKFRERSVTVADREVRLTPTEYSLLQELALNPNHVLTHTLLLRKIWGPEYGQEREYLRIFVGRLRKKLEPDPGKPNYIVTIPWVGYKLSWTSPVEVLDAV